MRKQIIIIAVLLFVGTNLTFAQKMTVKDNNANVLMEVNDEGTVGSVKVDSIKVRSLLSDSIKTGPITFPLGLVPLATTYKLYNNGGALYWNGSELATSGASTGWSLTGNSGTTPGTNFLGTTDNQAFQIHVNNIRALRIEPNETSPNLIGGFSGNSITLGVIGATIGGGGENSNENLITDDYGTISGGKKNQAGDNVSTTTSSLFATIGGGNSNTASAYYATVGGGAYNNASGNRSTISGGENNSASGSHAIICGGQNNSASNNYAAISGGQNNVANFTFSTIGGGRANNANGEYSTISGGQGNIASGSNSTIHGGQTNTASGKYATVGGGFSNQASGSFEATISGGRSNIASADQSTIGGGRSNTASNYAATVSGGWTNTASGQYATVPGGWENIAQGNYSLAAGRRAKANHDGAFVWADHTDADFVSTAADQFLIRATGGVGIGISNPVEKLEINGAIKLGTTTNSNAGTIRWTGTDFEGYNGISWSSLTAGGSSGDGDWTISGSDMYSAVSGNVGIGASTPTAKLHISATGSLLGIRSESTTYPAAYCYSTDSYGVQGVSNASSTQAGVYGSHSSSGNYGYLGSNYYGVYGYGNDSSYGIYGLSSNSYGVLGSSTDGYGVYGSSSNSNGVRGNSTSAYGVWGTTNNGLAGVGGGSSSSSRIGIHGISNDNYGVYGESTGSYAVYGYSSNSLGIRGASGNTTAIYGTSNNGIGVQGQSTNSYGVYGYSSSTNGIRGVSSNAAGVYGENTINGNYGWLGTSSNGVYGNGSSYGVEGYSSSGYGVYGSSSTGTAGYFAGNVTVTGTLSKGGGSFKIDHPLDPENKYLYHSFVESPDMMNVYNGNVILDAKGEALVELPEWFETLNRDFRYQLTAIGAPCPNLYIAEKISNNQFKIAGGTSGTEISWQITGIRQDPFANAYRIPVEENKPANERGKYLHPKAFGLSEAMGINYEEIQQQEQMAKQIQQERQRIQEEMERIKQEDEKIAQDTERIKHERVRIEQEAERMEQERKRMDELNK